MKKNILILAALLVAAVCSTVHATDNVFDLTTFCCPCTTDSHFCQQQFDPLNWKTNAGKPNGHFCMFSTDARRNECNTNGNDIAQYYNTLNTSWTTTTAYDRAKAIDDSAVANMSSTGPKPVWVALNEISGGTWPGNQTYRDWVIGVCSNLTAVFGRKVIVYSPFANPAANDADWTKFAAVPNVYICAEVYISGKDMVANAFSQSYCSNRYQTSKNTYAARGVPASKYMIVEHYGQTIDDGTTTWGRTGVSITDWHNSLAPRTRALLSVSTAGYNSYCWGCNSMLETDANMAAFAQTYATNMGAIFGGAPPPPTITNHVQSITMSWVKSGSKYKARAVVNVVDASGAAVSGATVTGDFTGAINNSGLSGTSDSSGNATITSTSSITTGTVTFTVTNITGTNMSYNPAANVVTSASETR